ncbi:MAG TPA: sugar ABC transporter permease [Ktedonobacteraceae bacterium]|nr:sugar ABC transporter permease [Ktedonobacteraceae bacterium]
MQLTAKTNAPQVGMQGQKWHHMLKPWVWIAPAILMVTIFLFYPMLNTIWLSFFSADSSRFVGLDNYRHIFTSADMLATLKNNLLWLVLGTTSTVLLGLVIAVLVDRVRFESQIKATIFVPMAISLVGAGVIWRFIYQYSAPNQPQIGLLNAIVTSLGGQPQAWLITPGWNNIALIVVYVWMWTGFCMVILSAALKSIPSDILEAARTDGANSLTIFLRITVPMISPTIAVVATTMIINILKIFDIIYVMTGGNYHTSVVAVEFYQQIFNFNRFGIGSALTVLLLLAVIPVMMINIRRFRVQEPH